jgi:hypothetical protein
MQNRLLTPIFAVFILLVLGFGFLNIAFSQTQRNPVIEFCTGTW